MFTSARLKLTAWYLVIIMAVSMAFSLMVYNILMREVYRFAQAQRVRIERYWVPPGIPVPTLVYPDPDLVSEVQHRIIFTLAVINAGILVISGGLGYFLAGRTLQPIQAMVDEQNRFISDASHELKTPLTSLKVGMEVFLRDKRPKLADAKSVISESLSEIGRLQSLSESLLQLTQYQQLNGQLKFSRVSTREVITAAVKKLEPLADKNQITISASGGDYAVNGSFYSLTDLLVILLDNAVKYSSAGSGIEINTQKIDHSVTISVTDHGLGIAEADLPHIFDRFYRADTARGKADSGGYGLGLAIAKKIVESHHGTISVTSRSASGSIFTLKLPLSRPTARLKGEFLERG
jgi:signal transduction histidine kinase